MARLEFRDGMGSGDALSTITVPFRTLASKSARRAYVGTLFFVAAVGFLFCVSIASYCAFYYNFVPQISVERPVHLQFGFGNPIGTVAIGPGLAHSQAYDVSVILYLPRTPSNLAAGNFMVDLTLLEAHHSVDSNSSTIRRSRRPAILPYASPLVDTARRLSRMPLFILNWKREAEVLNVVMMERMEFLKGKKSLPRTVRLEIHSEERMQFYTASVRFDARFTGLRWLMYKWRVLSFVIFSSTFWLTSVAAMSSVWMAINSAQGPKKSELKTESSDTDDSDILIKDESDGEDSSQILGFSTKDRSKNEDPLVKEEDGTAGSTTIESLTGFEDISAIGESAAIQSIPQSDVGSQKQGISKRRIGHVAPVAEED
ncbi:hypothetical protein LOZ53_002373 [Ophidiomyces ophidiicola]|nr:hypothetical protein LOZ55_003323 [Ophidiomyces ophidiicola]KAI1989207.1 hypothetical protein LOZ54_002945 [Ophidiomyces ophidiicola]KAI1992675.1 hypothetical protein LOZ53_002373 [Ophidiomyces ophidiicola]KAI1992953.1 hypothetical protein LOZ51_004267 [Ophidiomyces ophidiicola]